MKSLARYIWALPNSLIGLAFAPTVRRGSGGLEVVNGVLEIHSPGIAWVLRHCIPIPGGACAITLGHVVLGRDGHSLARSRAHERVHVRQYERWGPAFIPVYLMASAWAFVTGAGAYHGNRLEREAVLHECATRARCGEDMARARSGTGPGAGHRRPPPSPNPGRDR